MVFLSMTISACGVPMSILPEIRSTSEIYGCMQSGVLKGIPISGVMYLTRMLGSQTRAFYGSL